MASLEGWDLERYRRHLRERASKLRRDPRVMVRFDESDLVQETLLHAAEAQEPDCGTNDRARIAWLEKIQDNLLIDKHREHFAKVRDVRRDQHEQSLRQALHESAIDQGAMLPDSSPPPDEKAARQELRDLADRAIDQLPEEQREVLRLRKQGWNFDEIAQKRGITKGAAYGHYRRALIRLRDQLRGPSE